MDPSLTSEYLITSEVHPLLVIITVDSIKKSATLSLDRSWVGLAKVSKNFDFLLDSKEYQSIQVAIICNY